MKRWLPVVAAALVLAAPAHARGRHHDRTVLQSDTQTYPAKSVRNVHVDFTVGELRIEGTQSDQVTVKLYVHCRDDDDRCERMARDLRLDARTRGSRLDLEVEGHSLFDADDYWVEGVIQVPSRVSLDVDMPIGEVTISDVKSDVDLRLKVGEATVSMKQDHVAQASAAVTIGEATIDNRSGSDHVEGLFGRRVSWREGRGDARVDMHIGVGEANIRLY